MAQILDKDQPLEENSKNNYEVILDVILSCFDEHFGQKYGIDFDDEDYDIISKTIQGCMYASFGQFLSSNDFKNIVDPIVDRELKKLGW